MQVCNGVMKKKKEELELALRGKMSAHQRLMRKTMLTHVDFLNEQLTEYVISGYSRVVLSIGLPSTVTGKS